MIIVWALSWWYGSGWKAEALRLRERLESSYDYFSIDTLMSTLFSPYKQIAAGQVAGPIDVKLRAFLDRLISRVIGAIVRLLFIIVGSVWLFLQAAGGVIVLALWGIVPFIPVIGFIVMLSGWVPAWT